MDTRFSRRGTIRFVAGVSLLSLLPPGAFATPALSEADARSVKAVVQAQLKAFGADDAKLAFSFAADNVHAMFGTADNFIAMVRSAYPMVYRPASVAFERPELQGTGEVVQRVILTDSAGGSWLATYALDRRQNKPWRITGCVVQANKSRSA